MRDDTQIPNQIQSDSIMVKKVAMKTITVKFDTWKEMLQRKLDYNADTIDALIKRLLEETK